MFALRLIAAHRWTRLGLPVLVILALAVGRWAYLGHGYARLLSVDADLIPGRPSLDHFAQAQAPGLYRRNCAACHGADMKGDPRLGTPNLTDQDWLYSEGRVFEIEQTLTHGVRSGDPKSRDLASMPAFARPEPYGRYHIPPLHPQEVRDVTEYLLKIEGQGADPAGAARGDGVFHGAGGCYDCHGQDAHGDGAIGAANLADRVWLYGDGSRAAIADSIAQGRAGVCPAWIRRLSPGEIRALAVYIHDRAQPKSSVAVGRS